MNTEEINRKYNELVEETTNFYNTLMAKIEANRNEAINKAEQNPKVGKFVKVKSGGLGAAGCGYIGKLIEKPSKKPLKYSGELFELSKVFVLCYHSSRVWGLAKDCDIEEASESQVIDFLKQEAEKRYKDVNYVKSMYNRKIYEFDEKIYTGILFEFFHYKGVAVLGLNTGEWSEVVDRKEIEPVDNTTYFPFNKQEEKPLDIKETLKKYIQHVEDCEGSNFILKLNTSESDVKFTQEEVNLLEKLSKYPTEPKEEKEMFVNMYRTCGIERTGNTIYDNSKEAIAVGNIKSEDSQYIGTFKLTKE